MMNEGFWPPAECFLDISNREQLTDGRASCISVAICDEDGHPTLTFRQGQVAHFFYEFGIQGQIGVPGCGLEFRDVAGKVVHGKNTFQYNTVIPREVLPGSRLRCHQTIALEVSPGEYFFTVGLASTDEALYLNYRNGPIGYTEFAHMVREHCRAIDVGRFTVGFDLAGKLLHHGVANLPGCCHVTVVQPTTVSPPPALSESVSDAPAIFHVTHQKAGSQWIHKILQQCVPERIVSPQLGEVQFRYWPIQIGKVYPTVYVTRQQFDEVRLPSNWHRFVVIRDLRDTLISAYFSIKISHPVVEPTMADTRTRLHSLSLDDGLTYLMDEWLPACARIQLSWLEAGERLIRYEDLLEHDLEILEPLMLDECQLPVSRERFREAVLINRFERMTNGRLRGQEDVSAHERKGIAGDWCNYFSDRVRQAFKARYGGLLVATGYETGLTW